MTTTTIETEVKEYMRGCVEAGDCVNPSMLAEAACDEFDAWDEDDYVPLGFFEWAYEVIYEPVIEADKELGAKRFAIGQPDSRCANQAQLDGWYEAAAASATVASRIEDSSIESDHEFIRRGC